MTFTDAEMMVWAKIIYFEYGVDLGYTKPWEELDEKERGWWLTSAKSAHLITTIRRHGVTIDLKCVAELRREAREIEGERPEDSAQSTRDPLH